MFECRPQISTTGSTRAIKAALNQNNTRTNTQSLRRSLHDLLIGSRDAMGKPNADETKRQECLTSVLVVARPLCRVPRTSWTDIPLGTCSQTASFGRVHFATPPSTHVVGVMAYWWIGGPLGSARFGKMCTSVNNAVKCTVKVVVFTRGDLAVMMITCVTCASRVWRQRTHP